ncbi:hypothetical protein BH24ACT19_BH24ACT19_01000 [soil metagenome]
MKLKAMFAVGATAVLAALSAGEAEAKPVVSSWYGPGFEGNPTASGDIYRPEERTAAHRSLPFGTELLVTYGGRETVVEVNDRGPYVEGRSLDLSRAAAAEIGLTAAGADSVDVQILEDSDQGEASRGEYTPRTRYVVTKYVVTKYAVTREDPDLEALRLVERPYLKVLAAAFTPYSRPSTSACQEASIMFSPTPTAPQTRLPSVESMRTRVVAAVARCSSSMRTL